MPVYVFRATTIVPADVVELPDGQAVAGGTSVELPEVYGENLVDLGLATREDDDADGDGPSGGDDVSAEHGDAIADAIEGLDDADFGADGKPKVPAINAAMPEGSEPVTAAERDQVWEALQAADAGE